jgi:hypothetical protein
LILKNTEIIKIFKYNLDVVMSVLCFSRCGHHQNYTGVVPVFYVRTSGDTGQVSGGNRTEHR